MNRSSLKEWLSLSAGVDKIRTQCCGIVHPFYGLHVRSVLQVMIL